MLHFSHSFSTIEKTIRISIILISSLAILTMAGLGWKLSSDAKDTTLKELSEISKKAVEARLEQNIQSLVNHVQQISNAALISNSLMDSYGRESYLLPFMEQKTAVTGLNFALYDYRGRLNYRSAFHSHYNRPSTLANLHESQKTFDIRLVPEGHMLEIESPVLHAADSRPIGYLVASIPVAALFADATLTTRKFFHAEINLKAKSGDLSQEDATLIFSDEDLHLLADIRLQPLSTDFPEAVQRLGFLGLLVTLVIFVVSLMLGRVTARMISAPITQLTEAVMALRDGRTPACNISAMPKEISLLASLVFVAFRERSAALRKLESLAHFDNLTSILSRARFDEDARTSLEVALRSDGAIALVYIDLDFFKVINDRYGHDAGDLVLRELSQRMSDRLRTSDLLGRRGGDEFVILLRPSGNRDDVALLCWELATLMSVPIKISDEINVRVGVSMGAAFFPFDADSYEELVTRADKAMYAAKNGGRGRLVFSSGEIVELEPSNWAPAAGTRN